MAVQNLDFVRNVLPIRQSGRGPFISQAADVSGTLHLSLPSRFQGLTDGLWMQRSSKTSSLASVAFTGQKLLLGRSRSLSIFVPPPIAATPHLVLDIAGQAQAAH
jgi:hypothetical protein